MFYYCTADDAINTEIAAEPDSTSQVEVESGDSTPTAEPKSTVPNGIETASVSSHTSAPTGRQTRMVIIITIIIKFPLWQRTPHYKARTLSSF